MGSLSVSPCICCMFVSCVHPVAVLNAALCMTCSLLMLVEDARGDHMEEECILQSWSHDCLCSSLCACSEMLWMCVLYVSFGSKIRPRTFGCVAMRYVSVFWLRWCGWCWGKWVGGLDQGLGGWGCVMSVCVVSLDVLS